MAAMIYFLVPLLSEPAPFFSNRKYVTFVPLEVFDHPDVGIASAALNRELTPVGRSPGGDKHVVPTEFPKLLGLSLKINVHEFGTALCRSGGEEPLFRPRPKEDFSN